MIGSILDDRYEIISQLGAGSATVVYKARHQFMNRLVAIKVLQADSNGDRDTLIRRFKREARAVSTLDHPNIVAYHDFGVLDDGRPYLVMDLVEGETLSDAIAKQGHLPAEKVSKIFRQAATALLHAHQHGIIHRDVKPDSIVLQGKPDDQDVKIVDFGVAWMDSPDAAQSYQLSSSGNITGSPSYMSPEQCLGRLADARSDVYSLGCVMYEALVGKPPFAGSSPLEIVEKQVKERLKPPKEINPAVQIPEYLQTVLFTATEKDPAKRYQSMSEFCSAIETSPKRSVAGQTKSKHLFDAVRKNSALLCLLLMLIFTPLFLLFWSRSGEATVLLSRMKLLYASVSGGPVDANLKEEISKLSILQEENKQLHEAAMTAEMLVECYDREGLRYAPAKLDAQLRVAELLEMAGKHRESQAQYCQVKDNAEAGLEKESKRPKLDARAKVELLIRLLNALPHCPEPDKSQWDLALQQTIGLYGLLSNSEQQLVYEKQLLELRRKEAANDRAALGEACHQLAQTYAARSDKESAYSYFRQALNLEKAVPGCGDLAYTLLDYGKFLLQLGEAELAVKQLKESLQVAKVQGNTRPVYWHEVYAFLTYAIVAVGKLKEGDLFMQEQLRGVAEPMRKKKTEAILRSLSYLNVYEGNVDRTLAYFDECFRSMKEDPRAYELLATHTLELAARLNDFGRCDQSVQIHKKVLKYFEEGGLEGKGHYPLLVYNLGEDYLKKADYGNAEREFAKAIAVAKGRDNVQNYFVPSCLLSWSRLCAKRDQHARSIELLKECIERSQAISPPDQTIAVKAFQDLIRAYIEGGHLDLARAAFEDAQRYCASKNLQSDANALQKEFLERLLPSKQIN